MYMKTRTYPMKQGGQVIVHCNRTQGRRTGLHYKYTKSNMELVVAAFRDELQLLRDMVYKLSVVSLSKPPVPPPPPPTLKPPVPPPPPTPPPTPPPPPPTPTPKPPVPPPAPPPVPKTNANWKGRTRTPAAPPKAVPEDFRQQMARYKTYYNKYPNLLKNIPLIEFRKVDRWIPKGANRRPTAGVGNRQFENVLRNAVNEYRKQNR